MGGPGLVSSLLDCPWIVDFYVLKLICQLHKTPVSEAAQNWVFQAWVSLHYIFLLLDLHYSYVLLLCLIVIEKTHIYQEPWFSLQLKSLGRNVSHPSQSYRERLLGTYVSKKKSLGKKADFWAKYCLEDSPLTQKPFPLWLFPASHCNCLPGRGTTCSGPLGAEHSQLTWVFLVNHFKPITRVLLFTLCRQGGRGWEKLCNLPEVLLLANGASNGIKTHALAHYPR